MMNTIDNNTISKLRQLVSSRYGKGVEIRQLSDLSGEAITSEETLSYMKGTALHIPISCNGARLGTAIVPNALDLNDEKKSGIAQVIRMVLEPTMYNWYLERKEANLEEINKANLEYSLTLNSPSDSEESFEEFIADDSVASPQLLSNLIHLVGTNENLVKKVALQLHEMTHRWAFVPWSDVKDQIQKAEDILKMGAMTLFIDKIENLNDQEQDLLVEFLNQEHNDEHPLIITASKLSILEIENSLELQPALIDELSVNTFEVDRAPLSFQSLKEVLELFFFRTDRELDS